ncbi:hypothetical protein ACHAXT_008386 [Thalassiosira profunda]
MMQSSHSQAPGGGAAAADPDAKIRKDLSSLSEQISLCQSMLANAGPLSSISANEALLTVIGFLEACVPRMVELISAASTGALKPETFEECLQVNDKLTNVLADVEKDPKDRQPLTPAASASTGGGSTEGATGDIDQGMKEIKVCEEDLLGGKTTGMDNDKTPSVADPFGGTDLLAPTPPGDAFKIGESTEGSTGAAPEATDAKSNDDDFDAVFKDRTSAP